MSYLDIYRSRILANGNKSSDGIVNASKQTVKNNFDNSLFSELVLIDKVEYAAIVTQGKTSNDRKLLLQPDTKVDIGSAVEISGKSFLIMDFQGEGINEVYPTVVLRLTNSTYPIKTNGTKTLILDSQGKPKLNQFGDPIYKVTEGTITNVPCIVENMFPSVDENRGQILLPQGQLRITLQYQGVYGEEVKVNHKFTMYNNTYQIRSVDYTKVINGKGILLLNVEEISDKVVK